MPYFQASAVTDLAARDDVAWLEAGAIALDDFGSVLGQLESRFGERPMLPRFTLVLAVEAVERPVVPRVAVGPH